MKILIIETQKSFYSVIKNDDGSLILKKGVNQKEICNPGQTIFNMGGVQGVIDKCKEYKSLESFLDFRNDRDEKVRIERHRRNVEWEEQRAKRDKEDEAKINALLSLKIIPATMDNIELIIAWLNRQNWGAWSLPKMSIGYSAQQYDCDGKQVTVMKFDKKIDGENMFKTPAPKRHLEKYQTIRI